MFMHNLYFVIFHCNITILMVVETSVKNHNIMSYPINLVTTISAACIVRGPKV